MARGSQRRSRALAADDGAADFSAGASPLYKKVKSYVLRHVNSGAWPEGHRLPSESEFSQQFGLSRLTVHRAIRELSEDGIVVRTAGVGTFVAPAKPQSTVLDVRNIADEIRERGHRHDAEVHLLRAERIDEELADAFNLPVGAEIFHSIVVHRENQVAVQLEDRYVNPSFAPGYLEQDFSKISPYQFLARFGQPDEVEHIIESVMPDVQVRRYLRMKPGEPCLLLRRRTWVKSLVASRAELFHPGARYRLGGRFRPKPEVRR
jgi:GntR family histidine utilization transcriptional repressor